MKKRRRKIKPIALLLALVMLITSVDLSFREPEKAEAAGVCECRDGYQVHKIPASKTIAQWAHGNSLLKEFEHSSPQHAHVFERGNKKYLGWVEPATTRRSEIYYSTDGYCIRSAKYPLEVNGQKNPARINDSSFDTCMWSGGDYNQVCVYGDSPGARRLDFMYVDYERAIDICRKLDLKIYEKNGVNGYHVYFCGFITVHNNGKKALTCGNNWNKVSSAMANNSLGAYVGYASKRYNIQFDIPVIAVPIVVRYWDVTDPDSPKIVYNEKKKKREFDTGIVAFVDSILRNGEFVYTVDVNFNEALAEISEKLTSTLNVYNDKGEGKKELFVGCQTGVNSNKSFTWEANRSLRFGLHSLAKLDELDKNEKYEVRTDKRTKSTSLAGKSVTAARLLESLNTTCLFEGVEQTSVDKYGNKVILTNIGPKHKCYLDVLFMEMEKVDYLYDVTRRTADYNPETKKYSNPKDQVPLIDVQSIKESNITTKNQFTKTLSSEKYPDYSDSAKENALGNMIVDGHVYTLSRAKLTMKPEEDKTQKWSNVNEKAIDWAGRTLKSVEEIDPLMYESKLAATEYTANYSISNYVGWMEEPCSTSGRVYQMEIFDVTDYPTWERVFRTGSTTNPNELTGFKYTSGLKNRDGFVNGSTGDTTLPTVKGSNAYNVNAGAIKPGYAIRFQFETVGMLEDADDVIRIEPSFVWISPDGQTRKSVDVYYTETFGGKQHQLVKVGSSLDATNKHALSLGDDEWGIEQVAIDRTAECRGYNSAKELMDQREYCWNPSLIQLKSNMNTFDGILHETILSDGTPYSWDQLKSEVIAQNAITGVTKKDVEASVQNWYCNYYLPSQIYVTPKGTRIEDYVKTVFTGEEDCWIQDGYLAVNFDVVTIDGGRERLTYNCLIHKEPVENFETGEIEYYTGKCNMWDWEGYINDKMDTDGITFRFKDGDMFMYELGKSSANSDYTNGGIH